MGRLLKHRSGKTYSRVACYGAKEERESKYKKPLRKSLPKFEDLFLLKGDEDDNLDFESPQIFKKLTKKNPSGFPKSDSSSDLINDTFDVIAKLKVSDKENLAERKCENSPMFSSSKSYGNESFLSALDATTSKVSEMFIATSPEPNKEREKKCTKLVETSKTIKRKESTRENVLKNTPNAILKEKNPILNPLINVITSTPTLTCIDGARKLTEEEVMLENELSPVSKDESCVFEMSSFNEFDIPFLSCHLYSPNAIRIFEVPKTTTAPVRRSDKSPPIECSLKYSLGECYVSLKKLDSKIVRKLSPVNNYGGSNSSEDLFKEDTRSDSSAELNSWIENPSNSRASSAGIFRRVTRRRRIVGSSFKIWKRRKVLVHRSRSSLKDFSHLDTNATNRMLGKSSSILDSKMSKCRDKSVFEQEKANGSVNVSSDNHSRCVLKVGKGWRRSLKKISTIRKLQSFSVSYETVEQTRDAFNKSSVLQFILSENEKEEEPRTYVLQLCSQDGELSLSHCINERLLENCKKIGEGVYGEVFMAVPHSSSCKPTAENHVLKLMPIEGDFTVNGEPQKTFKEIAAEIAVSKALSDLRNEFLDNFTSSFVGVHRCWCVRGSYPPKLLELWDEYARNKRSENDRPDIFPDCQLHVILEFEFAGQDLESFVFNNAMQALSSFLQVAYALSVAEEALEFEHRDLHWGNVLIAKTSESFLHYKIRRHPIKLKTNGVKATVIDFTLSRLLADGRIFFNDLATDPSLFTADGDYQFEIYRKMQENNENNWKKFTPITNIYWLHYLVLKLQKECHFKNKTTKLHKEGIKKLKDIADKILKYKSALQFTLHEQSELLN